MIVIVETIMSYLYALTIFILAEIVCINLHMFVIYLIWIDNPWSGLSAIASTNELTANV